MALSRDAVDAVGTLDCVDSVDSVPRGSPAVGSRCSVLSERSLARVVCFAQRVRVPSSHAREAVVCVKHSK